MSLQDRIEAAITKATGIEACFANTKTAHGGCINDSRIVSLKDGREFFIKTHPQAGSTPGIFETEFEVDDDRTLFVEELIVVLAGIFKV